MIEEHRYIKKQPLTKNIIEVQREERFYGMICLQYFNEWSFILSFVVRIIQKRKRSCYQQQLLFNVRFSIVCVYYCLYPNI